MGALGHSGVMLTDRGVRCLGLWFSIGICGIYLVFALQAALEEIFTTTFTGNKYLPHLVCPVIFFEFIRGGFFFLCQQLGIKCWERQSRNHQKSSVWGTLPSVL